MALKMNVSILINALPTKEKLLQSLFGTEDHKIITDKFIKLMEIIKQYCSLLNGMLKDVQNDCIE